MPEIWREALLRRVEFLARAREHLLEALPRISAEHRSPDDTVLFEETLETATQIQTQIQRLRLLLDATGEAPL